MNKFLIKCHKKLMKLFIIMDWLFLNLENYKKLLNVLRK